MQTYTIIYSTLAGKGALTIIRANSGSEAFRWAIDNCPDLNPRRKMAAIPRDNNHALHHSWA